MKSLEDFVGKYVDVETTNGEIYQNWYVCDFTDKEDRYDPYEDSITLKKSKNDRNGIFLFPSDIKSIKIVN